MKRCAYTNEVWYNERSWTCLPSFIWVIILFNGPFECDDVGIFKLLRWVQKLHQSIWKYEIVYADRSSKDEQLLKRPLLRKTKKYEHAGRLKLKHTFYSMERTHKQLYLDKWSLVHWNILYMLTSLIWIVVFFDGTFEYGGGSKFWGYVWSNAELLCVEVCNFVQCNIFVSYRIYLGIVKFDADNCIQLIW
jgi:hypothetical protein